MDKQGWRRVFPFLEWRHLVNKQSLKSDLMAGLTGAVIVLPQGIAFSMIAGLPPIYGLYTAIITPIVAALFGSSRHLVSGPTTTSSIAVFATVSMMAEPQSHDFISYALVLTVIVGILQLSLGISRLGSLVNFISSSVVTGYTAGAAILIAAHQIQHLLGITLPNDLSFLKVFVYMANHFADFNPYAIVLGVATILLSVFIKKLNPKLPHLLLSMLFGATAIYFFGSEAYGIKVVGELPSGLPVFHIPNFDVTILKDLIPGAFAVAMLGAIEITSISRSISSLSKQRLDSNQEFIGLGLSNIVGGFFSCYAGSGSFTRSGLNYASGAKTPMAAVLAALFLLCIIFLLAPWASLLPIPTIGGIILIVAYSLIDFKNMKKYYHAGKSEFAVMMLTFLATLFINLQFAIFVGVFSSLLFYLMRTSHPSIVELAPNIIKGERKFMNAQLHGLAQCPQLHIIRVDGSFFFGAVENIKSALYDISLDKKYILIVGSGINFIDASGADLLVEESERLKSIGGALHLCHLKKSVRDYLDKGYKQRIGTDHIFYSKETALAAIYPQLDAGVCATCKVRIFNECKV